MLPSLRLSTLLFAAVLPSATFSALAPVQPDPAPASGEDIENIIVTGQRPEGITLQKFMLDFIAEIGDPVSDNRGYARWRNRVCVGVSNLDNAQFAQHIVDRVSAVALDLGLQAGEPGCKPNISIVFSTDGRALAETLVAAQPRTFRPYQGTGGTTQGRDALRQFTTSDAPVRWWQITMVVDRVGAAAIELPGATEDGSLNFDDDSGDTSAPSVNGLKTVPWMSGVDSRIVNSVSDELQMAYVIVDLTKLGKTTVDQLSDYVAMVTLAQVNPDRAPAGYASILNLFNATSPPGEMTELDRTYLRGLYTLNTKLLPEVQLGVFANTMVREQNR